MVLICLAVGWAACAERAYDNPNDPQNPAQDVEIIDTYTINGPQLIGDLDFDDEDLRITDQFAPSLYRVRASNGNAVSRQNIRAPAFGVADDGTFVWVAEPSSAQLLRLDPAGVPLLILPLPGGTPRGIAFSRTDLTFWVLTSERMLYRIDPNSGPVGTPVPVPSLQQPAGLTLRGDELWAIDQLNSRLVHLGPDGQELASYRLPTGNAIGLTDDDERFYYSDNTNQVRIIRLRDED